MIYLASLEKQTEDKLEGYQVISSVEELRKLVIDSSTYNKVIIRCDFAREFFTPSGLASFVSNAKKVNKNLIIEVDEKSNVITSDKMYGKLDMVRNPKDMLALAVMYSNEFFDLVKSLMSNKEELREELMSSASKDARLQATIESQRKEIEQLKYNLELEREGKVNAQSKLDAIVKRINYQYNVGINESKMFLADQNKYDKIIYLKEITRVQYTDTFVYYLKEVLKILYGMPTRLTVIEPYYGSQAPARYPELKAHYELKESDVISGDILMLGYQPMLMQDILKNASSVSILIVLDRGQYKSPHIKGDNVEYYYLASDAKDIPAYIPKSRQITYSKDTLCIPFIREFEQMDSSTRLSKYSSLDIIKRIVKTIESK